LASRQKDRHKPEILPRRSFVVVVENAILIQEPVHRREKSECTLATQGNQIARSIDVQAVSPDRAAGRLKYTARMDKLPLSM
jgi:hypothetical protein